MYSKSDTLQAPRGCSSSFLPQDVCLELEIGRALRFSSVCFPMLWFKQLLFTWKFCKPSRDISAVMWGCWDLSVANLSGCNASAVGACGLCVHVFRSALIWFLAVVLHSWAPELWAASNSAEPIVSSRARQVSADFLLPCCGLSLLAYLAVCGLGLAGRQDLRLP